MSEPKVDKAGHVREALPGYVTGGLSERDRDIVAAHVAQCDECRAEVESLARLHTDVANELDAEPGPSPRVKQAVFAAIAADEPAPNVVTLRPRSRVSEWLRAPSMPRWAQAAAIAVIVLQAGLLVRSGLEPSPATDATPRGLSTHATRLRVVFNPQSSQAQMRELLGSIGGQVIAGPNAEGTFVIELRDTDPVTVADALRAARAHPDVLQSVEIAP